MEIPSSILNKYPQGVLCKQTCIDKFIKCFNSHSKNKCNSLKDIAKYGEKLISISDIGDFKDIDEYNNKQKWLNIEQYKKWYTGNFEKTTNSKNRIKTSDMHKLYLSNEKNDYISAKEFHKHMNLIGLEIRKIGGHRFYICIKHT